MKLWKWILLFAGGIVGFLVLYSVAQSLQYFIKGTALLCLVNLLSATVMLLLYSGCVRLFEKRKAKEISLSRLLPDTLKGIGIGAMYFCLVVALMMIAGCYSIKSYNGNVASLIVPCSMFLVVAVGEEVIFRGVMFRLIDQRWNTAVALMVSAAFFGVAHIFNPGASLWTSFAIAIEAGLLLGAAYKYSGNLWCPIGIHWAWNFIQGNVLGFAVSGTGSGESLLSPSISGPDILSGGRFGAEGSILAVAVGLALSVYFLRNMSKKRA
ncbi:MAG: CPBP family intramembrane metalloprotease [Bacteroidales bacterium]|nr:CPBP family intramembrane metalloprotease [Bacteroidales bacterium]